MNLLMLWQYRKWIGIGVAALMVIGLLWSASHRLSNMREQLLECQVQKGELERMIASQNLAIDEMKKAADARAKAAEEAVQAAEKEAKFFQKKAADILKRKPKGDECAAAAALLEEYQQ